MAEKLKERKDMDKRYFWDLTSLFKNDAAWEKALKELDKELPKIAQFQGKLKDAKTIARCYKTMTKIELKVENLFSYAHQRKDEDTRADKAQSMYARVFAKYVAINTASAYIEPEILSLPKAKLEKIAKDKALADFRYNMEKLLRAQPHTLSAEQENVLAQMGESFATPREVANTLMDADLVFAPVKDAKGKTQELTESNYILLQRSTDRTLRKNAFDGFYKTYGEHNNTFAATYAAQVKTDAAGARMRHFAGSRAAGMHNENIPAAVYDGLIKTIHKHMPTMYRYLKLRKKILGIRDLHYYDIYAPLAGAAAGHYTYEQAQKLVLEAVSVLGKEYTDTVKKAFRDRWIDVYPNRGKRGGAYSGGSYESNPYILLNYNGTLNDVSTLIHEMGHSMHSWYSKKHQPPQYAGYTIFVAEVASTVNENLLVETLLQRTKAPKQRMALLNQYLEGFKATVFRQTMFAEFEMKAHAMQESGRALNATELNRLYLGLIKDYFGKDLIIDEAVQYEWSRIPHFYRPFYVYKYATGYSAAVALSDGILTKGDAAVKKYLEFLSLGGSCDPIDALKHAGVDLTKTAPIEQAMKKFARVLDEAEEVAKQLK
ncbi:MAG: oligoendopeptidase F [Lachnospiraceae bacterium]|nr:oligoendopeptidase F [Lachnospiraceae bacterium]